MPPLPTSDLDSVLRHSASHWQELRGQQIFLTGGTGFFGKWLVESFLHINQSLALGAGMTVLSRDPQAFLASAPWLANREELHWVEGDVRSFAFPAGRFPYVIHAATEASADLVEQNPAEMLSTQSAGTARVLEFAAEAGTRKLLLTSSGAVYGAQPAGMTHVPEEYAGAPDPTVTSSVYGEGKRLAELMGALAARGSSLEVKIARCFAFVGPHLPLDTHFAAGNFLQAALRREPIRVAGDGTPMRSYLYASDLAAWLYTILFAAPALRPFNVGSEESVSIRELAEQAASLREPALSVEVARKPVPGAAPLRYVPSTSRARHELGLHATVPLREALERTLAWHLGAASASRAPVR